MVGMSATRQQAIIWTNDGLVYWRILWVTQPEWVNSLGPGRLEWNFTEVILTLDLMIDGWCIFCEIALR